MISPPSNDFKSANGLTRAGASPFFKPVIQPKLTVNKPGDEYEQEADAMADKVMRTADIKKPFFSPVSNIYRKCQHCEEDEKLQRKETNDDATNAHDELENYVSNLNQDGQPLDENIRNFYKPHFGTDFSHVKIHADNTAAQSAKSINALAYTAGNHIVFNNGQYSPQTDSGKRLIGHELTHVVQQKGFLQRQTPGDSVAQKEINITDELLEIPSTEEVPVAEVAAPDETMPQGSQNIAPFQPYLVVQRKPSHIQRDDAPAATVTRKDLVFIMGTSGGFYVAAKKFFTQHHPEAEMVDFKDRSLGGIFSVLRSKVSGTAPAGNIYIVTHANQDGTLSFPLNAKDKDKTITFGELKIALKDKAEMFKLNGGIDDKTSIHIKGCNIGRNTDMLNVLDEAFGGKDKVDAPTHKQGYEFHSEKVDGKPAVVSSELFNTLIVEYPGGVDKDTDTLVEDFQAKYSQFGYDTHDWEMMIMGAKKYSASIDKKGSARKAEADKDAKEKKKDVDKTDKVTLKGIDADTKTAKAEVDTWMKEMKKSKVAAKSPGVVKKVDNKFTATLYDGVDPAINPAKALPFAGALLGKSVPKGFVVTKCNSITVSESDPLSFDVEFQIENKKTGESNTMTSTTPKLPKTEEDGSAIADELMAQAVSEKPEKEISRRNMYSWRIETKKGKNTVKVTAFLEMTQYKIDVDLKEASGDKIDPAKKEGDDFYYGSSDFE